MNKLFRNINLISLFIILHFICTFYTPTYAYSIVDDPQYIVMNFSQMNELNWAAPENIWQSEIKPKILTELHELKAALPPGTQNRKLAWSTLEEYMNTPLDTPSEQSVYAIKMRRILEITEAENLPVFLPLNGFQWWDELPELYNWWDPDGTHTPNVFFTRQKTRDFKERFIKGYNPDNKWNVEWQSFDTPMNLNWRNWGGGGFRLAPPPNLYPHTRTQLTYRQVLESRLKIMLTELSKVLERWEKEGKTNLFVGISIGTEVSLNASVTSRDEFIPYGFRGIQDLLCPPTNPSCGTVNNWTDKQIQNARIKVVQQYLDDLTKLTATYQIPKQRIYTHIWSESLPGETRYSDYSKAAFTLYSRPGMSFYKYGIDPLSHPLWASSLKNNGYPSWGAVEFSIDKIESVWRNGLKATFNSPIDQAKILVIYNWNEHKNTPAIPALKTFLEQEPVQMECTLPEILPQTPLLAYNLKKITWKYLPELPAITQLTIYINPGDSIATESSETVSLEPAAQTYTFAELSPGKHIWYAKLEGCGGEKWQTSEPRTIMMPLILPPVKISIFQNILLFFNSLYRSILNM